MNEFTILEGDALTRLRELPDESVHCCVTSPPYWGLRDYGIPPSTWPDGWVGCLGLEPTPEMFVSHIVMVFAECKRVLRSDGTLWLNLGDSYAGSWGAQSRGGALSDKSTLKGNGHEGGGPKLKSLEAVRFDAYPQTTHTGSWVKGHPTLKPKDLVGIPWRVAFALQADGFYLRSEIIWHKPNPMPESVTDRPTKSHEQIFLLAKSERYFYDHEAIKEKALYVGDERHLRADNTQAARELKQDQVGNRRYTGFNARYFGTRLATGNPTGETRNKRSVWTVTTKPFPGSHFATFPPDLIEPCILAGCPEGGTVLDPFNGAGTTGLVALRHGRKYIGIELNPEYATMARNRILDDSPMFNQEKSEATA